MPMSGRRIPQSVTRDSPSLRDDVHRRTYLYGPHVSPWTYPDPGNPRELVERHRYGSAMGAGRHVDSLGPAVAKEVQMSWRCAKCNHANRDNDAAMNPGSYREE